MAPEQWEGREVAFFLQGGRGRERWETQVFSAYTTREIGEKIKIESDLMPGGTGEQRLPSPTEGLVANSAGDMGSEPFSLVLRKTGSICLPGRCRKSGYWVAYGLSHSI